MKCPSCASEFLSSAVNRNLAGLQTCPQCGQVLTIGPQETAQDAELRARTGAAQTGGPGEAGPSVVEQAVSAGEGEFKLPAKLGSDDSSPILESNEVSSVAGTDRKPAPAREEAPAPKLRETPGEQALPKLRDAANAAHEPGRRGAADEPVMPPLREDSIPSLRSPAPVQAAPPREAPASAPTRRRPTGEHSTGRAVSRVSMAAQPAAGGFSLGFLESAGARIGIAVAVAVLVLSVVLHSTFSGGEDELPDEALATMFVAPDQARERFDDGRARATEGDHEAAVKAFTEALQADPDLAEAARELGLSHAELDDFERATIYLQQYLALRPEAEDAAEIARRLETLKE